MPRVIQKNTVNKAMVLKGGTYAKKGGDAISHVIYDTNTFQAATARPETAFFQQAQNDTFGYTPGGIKTLTETNMTDKGRFPAGQSFLGTHIAIAFMDYQDNNSSAGMLLNGAQVYSAWTTLIRGSVFQIKFPGTDFVWQRPGDIFLPQVSLSGIQATTVASGSANTSFRVGDWNHHNWVKLDTWVPISQLVTFQMSMTTQSGDSALQTVLNDSSAALATAKSCIKVMIGGLLTRATG